MQRIALPETAGRLVRVEADQHRLADPQRGDIDGETTRPDLRSRGACADFQSRATSARVEGGQSAERISIVSEGR
jgi:hypothetical protein